MKNTQAPVLIERLDCAFQQIHRQIVMSEWTTPLEIVFQEQSYPSFHSGQSLASDHFRGINGDPAALSLIPAAIGGCLVGCSPMRQLEIVQVVS